MAVNVYECLSERNLKYVLMDCILVVPCNEAGVLTSYQCVSCIQQRTLFYMTCNLCILVLVVCSNAVGVYVKCGRTRASYNSNLFLMFAVKNNLII